MGDLALYLTLKYLVEAEGHEVCESDAAVTITDDLAWREEPSPEGAVLLLATAASLPAAISAMREGAAGYIFVPLQPGEAQLMIRRALESSGRGGGEYRPRSLAEVEREHILRTVRHCNGNRAKAARVLGIGRNTLWRKLRASEEAADDKE